MAEKAGGPWVRHADVAEHLNLDARTLRGLMDRTPPDIRRPWADVGLGRAPRYRWESLEAAEAWLRTVCRDREQG